MKKLISLLLCFCFVFVFTACGNSKEKNESSVDLEYYAKIGKMPEVKYALGDDVDKIDKELSGLMPDESTHPSDDSHDHENAEFFYERVEGEDNVLLDNGTVGYYYNKEKASKGISYIVNYDKAFGFEKGTVSLEIKNALKGYELEEESVSDDNAFFAIYILNGSVLKAEIEDVVFMFVFQENELYATVMYDANNWSF